MSNYFWPHPAAQRRLRYPNWQTAFSLDALRRAWLCVRANKGKGNGETLAQFEATLEANLTTLQTELMSGAYRPKQVTRIYVPKKNDRWRPLTLWGIRDRVAQRAVYDFLEPIWDPQFLECSYGFRPNRATKHAAAAIETAYQSGHTWVFDADIKDCFDSMKTQRVHKLLGQWRVPRPLQQLINRWLHTQIKNPAQHRRTVVGTSQGGVISPLLCNLYLHSFDRAMQKRPWRLVRYADDFVIVAKQERTVLQAQRHAAHTLRQIGLDLNPHKTQITTFEEGFQFVGWYFLRGETRQLK